MPELKHIAESVQQAAEAISVALGIETEIVDRELTIIGGTNLYKNRIGKKEESEDLNGNYLYARVLREGKTVVVEDAQKDVTYSKPNLTGKTKELAEICTPIKANSKIIGIIGLVAFERLQQERLVKDQKSMVLFLERMADLLGSKASEYKILLDAKNIKNEIMTILETIHEGVLATDKKGYITYYNTVGRELLNTPRAGLLGKHIAELMPNTSVLEVLKTGIGYTEKEEVFRNLNNHFHFIVTTKPIQSITGINGVVVSFRDIVEAHKLVYQMTKNKVKFTFDDIIGDSPALLDVKNQALCVARGNSTVLITGESGTGKEMFAKAIHYSSSRQNGPFVTVNCGALPENLLESELFGYESGAFTGASQKGKLGKFELANGGTIFLDEIGELPLHLQVKLLHVLQNKRFERVGGSKTILADVRVIAATNRDLEEMIKQNKFREDLYYRLSVIPIKVPPLRARGKDVSILMMHFLKKYNTYMGKSLLGFSAEADEIYNNYEWPGNVRELENAVEYGVNMAFGEEITILEVPPRVKRYQINNFTLNKGDSLQQQLKRFEHEILSAKLTEHGKSHASKLQMARELGISRATLYRKLDEYDLT